MDKIIVDQSVSLPDSKRTVTTDELLDIVEASVFPSGESVRYDCTIVSGFCRFGHTLCFDSPAKGPAGRSYDHTGIDDRWETITERDFRKYYDAPNVRWEIYPC
jgi:hypothetical protein